MLIEFGYCVNCDANEVDVASEANVATRIEKNKIKLIFYNQIQKKRGKIRAVESIFQYYLVKI